MGCDLVQSRKRGGRGEIYNLLNLIKLEACAAVSMLPCSQLEELGGRLAPHARLTEDFYNAARCHPHIYRVRVAPVTRVEAAEGSSCDSSQEPTQGHARWMSTGRALCRIE